MKHKAPCSSRGYSGLRENGPLNIEAGRWWRCWWRWRRCWWRSWWWWWPPAVFRRHRKQGGESPPSSSSSSLTFSLYGRKGFPSGPWLAWRGRGESPSEIGSVSLSLSVSAFSDSAPSPFLLYPEIHNSDWGESFTKIFLIKLAFLREKKGINRLMGCPRGPGACPLPRGPLGHRLTLILLPKNHKYFKNIFRPFLSRLDSVWYWVSTKQKTCNRQELALGTRSIC